MRRAAAVAAALLLAGCATVGEPQVLRPFTTDGCSLFPNGAAGVDWCACCEAHDIAYWRGGSEAERERADEVLRQCVFAKSGNAELAQTMHAGVRAGGVPWLPTWYRWAYGWPQGRGYAALTDAERAAADWLEADWRARHPAGQCRPTSPGMTPAAIEGSASTPAGVK